MFDKVNVTHNLIKYHCFDNFKRLIDKFSKDRAKSTSKDFKNKISSAIKHAYAIGLIERDFTSSLRYDGYDTVKRNVVLSFEEYKKLRDYVKNKDRKSTRLNSSHVAISYAVFCLKKKKK